jgi:hypothetical protein
MRSETRSMRHVWRVLWPVAAVIVVVAGATLAGQDAVPLKDWTPPWTGKEHKQATRSDDTTIAETDRAATAGRRPGDGRNGALLPTLTTSSVTGSSTADINAVSLPFSYYYVSGPTLIARDSATGRDYSSAGCTFTTSGTDRILSTQLQVPDGAILKYLRLFYSDTDASFNVAGYITSYDAGTSAADITSVTSSGSAGVGTALSSEITQTVDNFGNSYVLIGWPGANSSTVQVCGLRVAYYVPPSGSFHPVTPCRVADTRAGSGFTGNYGPPTIAANATRTMDIVNGPCTSIQTGATAVSLNVTVTNTFGAGDLRIYGAPGSVPLASSLNYVAGQTIANAVIVPLGTSGISIRVDAAATDVIVDINGYFY